METYKEFENYLNCLSTRPKLLLHSCCAPCSTSVLELLIKYFNVDIFFYNPNIYPEAEYLKRKEEQQRLISELNEEIGFIDVSYNPKNFYDEVKGFEHEKEGNSRCYKCISLRMKNACEYAKNNGYDFFTTTLSVSPYKNSKIINAIGKDLEKKYSVSYLYSDFKKKDGYKKSILLSKKYGLYRQNYCGCQFSMRKN